jgi:hypothetical protein
MVNVGKLGLRGRKSVAKAMREGSRQQAATGATCCKRRNVSLTTENDLGDKLEGCARLLELIRRSFIHTLWGLTSLELVGCRNGNVSDVLIGIKTGVNAKARGHR